MTQGELFFDDIYGALRHVISVIGGPKAIGSRLWPEKPIVEAQNYLNACLNTERRETLNPEQLVFLLRLAKEAGCHDAMNWISSECSYVNPQPTEPEDELAQLQREFVSAAADLKKLGEQITHTEKKLKVV